MVAESAVRTVNLIAVVMLSAADTATIHQFCFIKFETAHATFHSNTTIKIV
jgi:hypothetical protein